MLSLKEAFLFDSLEQAERKWPLVMNLIAKKYEAGEEVLMIDIRAAAPDVSEDELHVFRRVLEALKEGM